MSQFQNKQKKSAPLSHSSKHVNGSSSSEAVFVVPAILKRSQINASKLMRGYSLGNYNSLFKNQGIEYSESNPYNYGDDSRYIDWNISSRMNELYTKYFREERNRTIWLMFDCSSSMNIGAPVSVFDVAMETALTLATLSLSHKDKVGAMIFDSKIRHYLPPSHLLQSLQRLCHDIELTRFSSESADFDSAAHFTKKILFQRSLVIVISDFIIDDCFDSLGTFANSHDILALRSYYDIQSNFPNAVSMNVVSNEGNTQSFISSRSAKKRYIENQARLKNVWQRYSFKTGMSYCEISTNASVFLSLAYFLRNQSKNRV